MKENIIIRGTIRNYIQPNNTGIYYNDKQDKREEFFPIGSLVNIKPAHWFRDEQIFRCYKDGKIEYFCHREVKIYEDDFPLLMNIFSESYGKGNYSQRFNEYMKKWN